MEMKESQNSQPQSKESNLSAGSSRGLFELKVLEKLAFIVLFIFVLAGVILSHVHLENYNDWYVKEDGLIEWLTVVALVSGSFVAVWRAIILSPFRGVLFKICLFILAMILLFGAGEEISWGQRIFEWRSPEFFAFNNSQGETNFHNLVVSGVKINKLIFGLFLGIAVAFYFIILPILYRRKTSVKELIDRMAIPIPRWFHLIVYLLLVVLCEMINGHKKGEILEFGGCWIFLLMFMEPYNRAIYSRITFDR